MNLKKILITVSLFTFLALAHVYQQSKIIQLAYEEQQRLALLENLIDKNNNFRYNINWRTSLVSMAGIWEKQEFEWPRQQQLASLSFRSKTSQEAAKSQELENVFAGLFRLRSQAEATQVKPVR